MKQIYVIHINTSPDIHGRPPFISCSPPSPWRHLHMKINKLYSCKKKKKKNHKYLLHANPKNLNHVWLINETHYNTLISFTSSLIMVVQM